MIYTNSEEDDNQAFSDIEAQIKKIEAKKIELLNTRSFLLKQGFIRKITQLLINEDIKEARYLGFLEDNVKFYATSYFLESAHYFDIQSVDKNIHYALDKIDEQSDSSENTHKLLPYAKRLIKNEYPIIRQLNEKVEKFAKKYYKAKRLHSDIDSFSIDPKISLTQDLAHNMALIMTPKQLNVWTALKEQSDLEKQIPNKALTKNTVKISPKHKI